MGMGPGPKTFGIGFGLWTRPDHPALSLGSFVTVVTAILPLFSLRLLHLMGYRVRRWRGAWAVVGAGGRAGVQGRGPREPQELEAKGPAGHRLTAIERAADFTAEPRYLGGQ